jgi:LuxR family transcriptional regulator, maltose regulon positive regulatory protein
MERQQLMQRLAAGIQGKLTVVFAPAGFGKSTLLGAWVQAREQPSAWLSLDEADRDPNQFAAYLTASPRSVSADLGDSALAMARARLRPIAETVLTHLINPLAMRRGRPIRVLDDYQFASGPEVDVLLAFLFDNHPVPVCLILISREVPAIPLARLRSPGQALDQGPLDLRFAAEETRLFLNQSMVLGFTHSVLAQALGCNGYLVAALRHPATTVRISHCSRPAPRAVSTSGPGKLRVSSPRYRPPPPGRLALKATASGRSWVRWGTRLADTRCWRWRAPSPTCPG